jgi:hypothetical protein
MYLHIVQVHTYIHTSGCRTFLLFHLGRWMVCRLVDGCTTQKLEIWTGRTNPDSGGGMVRKAVLYTRKRPNTWVLRRTVQKHKVLLFLLFHSIPKHLPSYANARAHHRLTKEPSCRSPPRLQPTRRPRMNPPAFHHPHAAKVASFPRSAFRRISLNRPNGVTDGQAEKGTASAEDR